MGTRTVGKSLFQKRIVVLSGEMNEKTCTKAFLEIQALNLVSGEPIMLYINSGGGDVHAMVLLANGIVSSKAEVIGVVTGRAESAAADVLQFCKKRLALPYAHLLLHAIRADHEGVEDATTDDLRTHIALLTETLHEREQEDMFFNDITLTRSRMSRVQLQELEDKKISAEQAKQFGLIDDIITQLP